MFLVAPLFVMAVSTVCLVLSAGLSGRYFQIVLFSLFAALALADIILQIIGRVRRKGPETPLPLASAKEFVVTDLVALAVSFPIAIFLFHGLVDWVPSFGGDLRDHPLLGGFIFAVILLGPMQAIFEVVVHNGIGSSKWENLLYYVHDVTRLLACTLFLCMALGYFPALLFSVANKGKDVSQTFERIKTILICLWGSIGFAGYYIKRLGVFSSTKEK